MLLFMDSQEKSQCVLRMGGIFFLNISGAESGQVTYSKSPVDIRMWPAYSACPHTEVRLEWQSPFLCQLQQAMAMGVAKLASESGDVPVSRWGETGSWGEEEPEALVQTQGPQPWTPGTHCMPMKQFLPSPEDPFLKGSAQENAVPCPAAQLFAEWRVFWRPLVGYRAAIVEKPVEGEVVHRRS